MPPLLEYSILNSVEVPAVVQVMFWVEQPAHDSPPLGEVIVMGGTVVVISNGTSETSDLQEEEKSVTLTKQFVEGKFGTVQGNTHFNFLGTPAT